MSAETVDPVICGETCPLVKLGDIEVAKDAREWAFGPPYAHEGPQDPRYPNLGMLAMHYGSLCRFRYLSGACNLEPPETATASQPV